MDTPKKKKGITGSALVVMISTGLSRGLGFVRSAVVSYFFGGAGQVDVLSAVFIIPNNLRKLVAEGALSSAFIPVLAQCAGEDNKASSRARNLVANLLGFQFLLLVPFLVFSVFFSHQIMQLMLGFTDPAQQDLAGLLFAWMINYVLLVSVSAILMAVLNIHGEFAVPALAPLLFSVSVILCLFMFVPQLGIMAQVVGVLFGGLLQIIIQIPLFIKYGYTFRISFSFWKNEDFRKVLRLWGPVILTSGVFTINEFIATKFASGLGPGSQTSMSNALIFWQLPMGIFAASINTILFPRMSRFIAQGKMIELRQSFDQGLRLLVFLLIPSAAAMMLFGRGIIGMALQRGAFTWANTLMTDSVLWVYSLGMLSSGLVNYFQRLFYAWHENKAPLISAFIIMAVDIALTLILIFMGFGVVSLAWAHFISASAGALALALAARKKLGGLGLRQVLGALLKAILPAGVIGLGYWFISPFCDSVWSPGSSWTGFALLSALGIGFIIIYLLFYLVLKVEAVDFIKSRFTKKKVEQ